MNVQGENLTISYTILFYIISYQLIATTLILGQLLAEALVYSGTLREHDRSPNLFLNFYHNQFSNFSSSILNKSESLETRIKSRTIAVAAIKTSASWIGVPLAFNLA